MYAKLKNKLNIRGSILAVSLIILGLMLVSALSFALVTIQERKASMGENKSNQAFQTASTGVEIVLQSIRNNMTDNTLANVDNDILCDGTVHSADGSYAVQLQDDAGNIVPCTSSVSAIKKVKSIGSIGQNQRAIEVAVAATCENGLRIVDQSTTANFDSTNATKVFTHLTTYNSAIVGFLCRMDDVSQKFIYLHITQVSGGGGGGNFWVSFFGGDSSASSKVNCNAASSGVCQYAPTPTSCSSGWVIYEACSCSSNTC